MLASAFVPRTRAAGAALHEIHLVNPLWDYRTHPGYFEAFGRVVLEAMLCGVPVVAEARGGYARHIQHGENDFLFEDPREAFAQQNALREDRTLRMRISRAAHETALHFFEKDLPQRTRRACLADSPSIATRPHGMAPKWLPRSAWNEQDSNRSAHTHRLT